MPSAACFSGELAFLNEFAPSVDNPYRQSRFLECEFDAPVWFMRTGKSPLDPIDFRVRLNDGQLLTDAKHRDLLEVFKCWLCVQDHPNACGGRLNSSASARHKIQRTLHLIDYLLLNARQFQLADHGLMAVSANDMRGLLIELGGGSHVHETLYGWSKRLAHLLREKSAQLEQHYIDEVVASVPEMAMPYEHDGNLGLDDYEIVRARAWLWTQGYYRRAPTQTSHSWMPDMARLCRELYANTLYGQQHKPPAPELFLEEVDIGFREHPRAPVTARDEEDLPTLRHISAYVAVIRPLELFALENLKVPIDLLREIDTPVAGHLFSIKAPGRFRTLPQEVVLGSLRKSVDFLLSNGDVIVDGYLHVVSEWKRSGLSFVEFARSDEFARVVPRGLRELGVARWCIRPLPDGHRPTLKHIPPVIFFKQFRANMGLYELLRVLYGATFFVLGTLSARRAGELEDLPQDCLDKSRTRLVFFNRKSAEADMRVREMRPIPRVAVRVIEMLQRLVAELKAMGLVHGRTPLLCAPSRMTGLPSTVRGSACAEMLLDMLCDYIETPLDESGRRYYIRQHQLRRFFVMLFFWGDAFGGLDTLRWFLGHTDIEHLWHYISESIPGAALRNIKAQFAIGEVLKETPEAEDLANLLESRYGTRDFSVLDAEELDQYVEELMIEGAVSVEPEFLELTAGRSYRVLITVRNQPTKETRHE